MIYSSVENPSVYDEFFSLQEAEKKYSFNLRGWKSKIQRIEAIDELSRTPEDITELYNSNLMYYIVDYELTEIKRRQTILESELFYKYKLVQTEVTIQNIKNKITDGTNPLNPNNMLFLEVQKDLPIDVNNNKNRYNQEFKQWGIDLEGIRNQESSLYDFVLYNKYYRMIDSTITPNIDVQNEISQSLGINIIINTKSLTSMIEKLNENIVYIENKMNDILDLVNLLTDKIDLNASELAAKWVEAEGLGLITDAISNYDERWIIELGTYLKETLEVDSISSAVPGAYNITQSKAANISRQELTRSLMLTNLNKLKDNFIIGVVPKLDTTIELEPSGEFSESKFDTIFPKSDPNKFFNVVVYPTYTTILQEGMAPIVNCTYDDPIIIDLL